jgi:hypothetical protein
MAIPFPTTSSSGISASPPLVMNGQAPTAIQCDVTGTATYTVQVTLNEVTGANWYSAPDPALVGATGSVQSNILTPFRAIRVNQTAGTGSVLLTVGDLSPGSGG